VLVHMDRIDDEVLKARLVFAWENRAPKKLVKAWHLQHAADARSSQT